MHRVHSMEIEVRTTAATVAESLLPRVSRMHARRLAPTLERVLHEHDGATLRRIDRLELDLGALALDEFEDAFCRKFEAALRAALADAAPASGVVDVVDTGLALLDCYARTGALPWWADTSEVDPVAAAVHAVVDADPRRLLALLQALLGDETALARLSRHVDGPVAVTLVSLAGPAARAETHDAQARLHRLVTPAVLRAAPTTALASTLRDASPSAGADRLVTTARSLARGPALDAVRHTDAVHPSAADAAPSPHPSSESPPATPSARPETLRSAPHAPTDAASPDPTAETTGTPAPTRPRGPVVAHTPTDERLAETTGTPAPTRHRVPVAARPAPTDEHLAETTRTPAPTRHRGPIAAHMAPSDERQREPDGAPRALLDAVPTEPTASPANIREPAPPAPRSSARPHHASATRPERAPNPTEPPAISANTDTIAASTADHPDPVNAPDERPPQLALRLGGAAPSDATADPLSPALARRNAHQPRPMPTPDARRDRPVSSPTNAASDEADTTTTKRLLQDASTDRTDPPRILAAPETRADNADTAPPGAPRPLPAATPTHDPAASAAEPPGAPHTPSDATTTRAPAAPHDAIASTNEPPEDPRPNPGLAASAAPAVPMPDERHASRVSDPAAEHGPLPPPPPRAPAADPFPAHATPTTHAGPSSASVDTRPATASHRRRPVVSSDPATPHPRRALDEYLVEDAGLVLLWPFLPRLMDRLALLDKQRQLLDRQARMQAIALVHALAADDPDPREFHLPLAKLLCGAAPTDLFVLADPLAPEQLGECEALLVAVVRQLPWLRDMPPEDFRADFLRRRGVLAMRRGTWQLRVERRPQDALQGRFPWTWTWIRLPWMTETMSVEW